MPTKMSAPATPPRISFTAFTPSGPVATNTVIITNLAPWAFQDGGVKVKASLEQYGTVTQFVLLKSFARVLAVFRKTADAQRARRELEKGNNFGADVRLYFGEHTDTTHLLDPSLGTHIDHLRVPELEKNFLLSPPGSPPVDWVQIRESGPVPGGHSEALLDALRELETDEFTLDAGDSSAVDESEGDTPGRQILVFRPPENVTHNPFPDLPLIIVENADVEFDFGLVPSSMRIPEPMHRIHGMPRTAMPPSVSV
ncbi:Calcipressin-domain-containing protein [Powellomyces hirtus]|nr:Calcipressin-domain-containing protein [Powellomyces hirtus]